MKLLLYCYTAMVGLAATSSVYGKWFCNRYYYRNQLVTALIGSAVCLPGLVHYIIDCYIFFECTDYICDLCDSQNKLSIN